MSEDAEVLLHGSLVGHLGPAVDGTTEFRFTADYRSQVSRPVLGQRFEDDLDRVWRPRKGQTLPDFFANLIPEGRLRELIEEIAGLDVGDDLGLLGHVGADLPGAITVRPADVEKDSRTGRRLRRPDGPPVADEGQLRFSLAGVQLKLSMLRDEEKLVLPMRGQGGEWIVKFPSPTFPDLPENELAILRWAEAIGFEVPECHLHGPEEVRGFASGFARGGRVLAVRRYDRAAGARIHQEDFAQAVGLAPEQKYEHVPYEAMATLVRRLIDDEAALELVRRLAFAVASGNGDAHLKNWSLVYPDRIRAALSPVYDQVATVAWPTVEAELALKLAGVRRFEAVDRAAFERLAERSGLGRERVGRLALEVVDAARATWQGIAPLLPPGHREALETHWKAVPLLREVGRLRD